MNRKNVTLNSIIGKELTLLLDASEKYPKLYKHFLVVRHLTETFFTGYVGKFDAGADLFLRFYTEFRNFYLLTYFSTVRLHSDQAILDLRRMTESASNIAYSIANPNYKDFVDTDEFGLLDASQDLKSKRNKWLSDNYPERSEELLKIKTPMQTVAHSNLVSTFKNSKHVMKEGKPIRTYTSFFDKDDKYLTEVGLWQLANTTIACLNLIYEINLDHHKIVFMNNYEEIHRDILKENLAIRDEFQNSKRFKKTEKVAKMKEEE